MEKVITIKDSEDRVILPNDTVRYQGLPYIVRSLWIDRHTGTNMSIGNDQDLLRVNSKQVTLVATVRYR